MARNKSNMADVASAKFYEIIGTGTEKLEEATVILKQNDPTLKIAGKRGRHQEPEPTEGINNNDGKIKNKT